MDIATIIGLAGAFAMVVMAMGDVSIFIDMPSVYIVVLGTAFTVLARSSIPEFIGAIGTGMKTIKYKVETPLQLIEKLVELGTIAKKDGMIALEGQEISNKFMAKGIRMMVDGTDPKLIKKALEIEAAQVTANNKSALTVWDSIKEVGPAMGMIGTLVGLVIMLGNMSDPKSIGPAFAVALLTTMYGAVIANMICIPVIQKVSNLDGQLSNNNTLIIEALMFIAEGGNPRLLPSMLAGYVAPKDQAKLDAIAG
ncbi:MAG: MotA/TolQ/ExbB proton channel family protein [Burkholderiaceae bacterium]|jgi:chemotaxis protein MotA